MSGLYEDDRDEGEEMWAMPSGSSDSFILTVADYTQEVEDATVREK